MTLYFDADGALCSVMVGGGHAPSPSAVAQLEVDEETNEQLLQIVQTAPESLRLAGEQLMWNDTPITPAPPGPMHSDRQMLPTIAAKVAAGEDLAADELQCAVRCLLRRAGLV